MIDIFLSTSAEINSILESHFEALFSRLDQSFCRRLDSFVDCTDLNARDFWAAGGNVEVNKARQTRRKIRVLINSYLLL